MFVAPATKAPKRKQQKTGAKDVANSRLQPAWVDDDDARVRVNLEEQKRLRKLRKSEADAVVDGHELQQRLKKQCVVVRRYTVVCRSQSVDSQRC